ncbi:hypothetical protein [Faecalicatena contorta]|uniref:hypothetical protein n=1 Tax=Faecalicatena contorta TaxID=39482 RepID=UPI001F33C62B|nr:hypothetical protein [Faecalicatena contorta]MCF2683747.1 hypothetical protein [Faecalicatena contorta]
MQNDKNLQQMFQELTGYEKKNVELKINGAPASPMQIVQAHLMREHNEYMREYVLDEEGDIKELRFQRIEK